MRVFLAGMVFLFGLTLAMPAPAAVLISSNAFWKYWKGTTEASTVPDTKAWRSNSFNDGAWLSGPTPFWYDTTPDSSTLPGGTQLSDMINSYTCIFMRQTFNLTNVAEISALRLGALCDDGFIAWINGVEVYRYNMPGGEPAIGTFFASTAAGEPVQFTTYNLTAPAPSSYLLVGANTLAIQVFNATLASSDIDFDTSLTSFILDPTPPVVSGVTPMPGTLTELTQITVEFNEPVIGVNATDLLINGQFASSVSGSGTTYAFTFLQPAYGLVQISWDVGHNITDLALPGNLFNATGPGATWQYTLVDNTPPGVASADPTPGFTVPSLSSIEVLFSEPVSGVTAGDLLINNVPATTVTAVTPAQYRFQFPQPASGTIQITWANNHGIQDLAAPPNSFAGGGWSYVLDPNAASTRLLISEFMAENDNGILDEDFETSDWIEVYNAGAATVNLANWFLTDNAANLDKWQFPSTNLPPNAYLLVWASEKNRRVAGAPLHTNFKLDGGGEYLALVRSNMAGGLEVVWEYTPKYPNQEPNLSYGLAMNVGPYSTLIPTGATAEVLIPTGDLGVGWTAPGFVDTGWSTAATGIGFDTGTNYDPGIATDIQAQMLNVNPSVFIRIPFTVPDPSVIQDLRLRLRYDDGLVAYLNGVEALRVNAPANPQWNSTATALHGSGSGASGILQADFDTVTNTYTASQQGVAPAPAIMVANAGSTGRFLRLIYDGVNNNINSIAFNQTAPGLWETITADFDFRIFNAQNNPADGFAFMLIPVSSYGTTGVGVNPIGAVEEPNFPGVFAIGFDVYPRATQNDVSAHWSGAEYLNVTIVNADINLTSGNFHHARVSLVHVPGGARVTVTLTPNINLTPGAPYTPINNLFIPGLNAFNNRVQFGGRTGGLNMNVDLDNIMVQFGFPSGMVPVEEFNLSSSLNTLVPGPNVLAIHGLNRAIDDGDFLISPELVGRSVSVQTNTRNYFTQPTPGAANEGGAAGLAGDVLFSMPGGVYTNMPNISVALSTLTPNATIRYTIDGTTPTAASPIYSTPLIIANSTVVKARVFASGLLPGRIIVQTYTMLGPDVFTFSSNLPLVIIDTFGQGIIADLKIPASMVFIDTYRGRASLRDTPDAKVRAGIELRGSSSLGFPKNNMGFETRDENTNDFKVSLLGMPAESDWVLYGPYTDKTLMNDYLAYELWEAMGHYSVRRRFVEVFRDTTGGRLTYGDYWGIYVLLEKIKIDNDRVDIAELHGGDSTPPNVTGGYIFKRDRFDGNEYTFNVPGGTGFGGTTLGVEDPKGAQITTAQKNFLVAWFTQVSAALSSPGWTNPVTGYAAYIDADSFIDHYWIVEMPKQIDGYRLSNFYHKDRNGKLKEGPIWDWNLSFGNADYLEGGLTNNYYAPAVGDADYLYYRRLFADPDFYQKHIDRWFALRTNVFATSNLMSRIDAITNLLNEAQVRDFVKWPRLGSWVWPNPDGANLVPASIDGTAALWNVNFATLNTYPAIIGEMKRWIEGRLAWIDSQFPATPPAFSLPGGTVPSGSVLAITAPAGTIYYTLNGTDPRGAGGNPAPGVLTYSGPITITTNVGVFARARIGAAANSWSGPTVAPYVIETPKLIITEIMFHPDVPPPGSTNVDEDFEYIEVKNNGATPINLLRSRISGGVDVELPNYVLNPGCYVVIVANTNAFRSRYGNIPVIVGSYTDHLANGGERIVFEGPVREPIHDFSYKDNWYELTDGFGFSLVPVNENGPLAGWGLPGNWRASSALRGSPGTNDTAVPTIPNVVINEALTHATLPQNNAVELHNFSGFTADISYWYLTDEFDLPRKYQFPSSTLIAANGYLVIYQSTFNAGLNPFSISSQGDELWLFSADAAGNLTGHFSGFDFGPQFNGVTFGYHLTSQGDDHFVAQTSPTLGAPNSGPRVGPIVISEVNYHPPDVVNVYGAWDNTEDEYIELHNISGAPVALHHPTNTSIVWKLRDAVDYSFAPGTTLPAGAYALIVSFDPTNTALLDAFKANNGVPNGTAIFGPYSGKLDNSSDSVELVRPDDPVAGEVPYVLADKVRYSDVTPWPSEADGFGPSLQRVNESAYGNDPGNWAAGKSPGSSFVSGNPPEITQQPQDVAILGTLTATFTITATGTPPLAYQWFYNNNSVIANATNSMLSLPGVSASQAGLYRCLVQSPSGIKFSSNATLTVLMPASITQQPANVFLRVPPDPSAAANRGATFRVTASTANPPLSYQWRFNGNNIPAGTPDILGINSTNLIVTNVVFSQAGVYSCAITDGIGTIYSANAVLGVVPFMLSASQPMTVPEGADISVSAVIQAYPPPFLYSWRRGTPVNTNIVSTSITNFATWNSTVAGYILTNNILSSNYSLRLVFTNLATTAGGVALINNNNFFTIVADTDRDGIPNTVETGLGLNPLLGADGGGDLDGDGMTNGDEYRAGTDPANPASYLRVDLTTVPGQATVRFGAVSNKTYTVQFAGRLPAPFWTGLADVPALSSNRVESFVDPTWTTNRVYRVVTPRQQ